MAIVWLVSGWHFLLAGKLSTAPHRRSRAFIEIDGPPATFAALLLLTLGVIAVLQVLQAFRAPRIAQILCTSALTLAPIGYLLLG